MSTIEKDAKLLTQIWEVMNKIRARDGAPPSYCKDEFHYLVEGLGDIVKRATGKDAHCNFLLYQNKLEVADSQIERANRSLQNALIPHIRCMDCVMCRNIRKAMDILNQVPS